MKNFNLIKPVIDVFKNALVGEFERDNSSNKEDITTDIQQIPQNMRIYSEPKINVNVTINVNIYRGYTCPIDGQSYVDHYK